MCMALGYTVSDAVLGHVAIAITAVRGAFIVLGVGALLALKTAIVQRHFQVILYATLFVVGIAKTVMIDQGGQFGQTLFQLLILLLLRINFTWVLILSQVDLAVYNIYASFETNVNLRSYLSILLFVLAFAYSGCYRVQVRLRVPSPHTCTTCYRPSHPSLVQPLRVCMVVLVLCWSCAGLVSVGHARGLSTGQSTVRGTTQDSSHAEHAHAPARVRGAGGSKRQGPVHCALRGLSVHPLL